MIKKRTKDRFTEGGARSTLTVYASPSDFYESLKKHIICSILSITKLKQVGSRAMPYVFDPKSDNHTKANPTRM